MEWCVMVLLAGVIGYVVSRQRGEKKWKDIFLATIAVCLLALLAGYMEAQNAVLTEDGNLLRRQTGDGNYETELLLQVDGVQEYSFAVEVPEQTLSATEEEKYLDEALNEIEEELKGENSSLEEIRKPLILRDSYQDNLVMADWSFDVRDIVDASGKILPLADGNGGTVVVATVELQCGLSSVEKSFSMRVFGEEISEEERIKKAIEEMILTNGSENGTEVLLLPKELWGHQLKWSTKESNLPLQILFLGMLVVCLLPELEKERAKEEKKKREVRLLLEYPELINKLTLLMGAGMTVQGAWNRITDMYVAARKQARIPRNELLEEMIITKHEIESGQGEAKAYEAFGERCGIPVYRKFSNCLVQNLKKGSKGLAAVLEKEAESLFAEKRNMARRYGEEATTKMLLPMLLMLGIVIFIIMVPAVISFQSGM